ncbi:AraC family transcriptional regulator ligand-binding domain-containing protein [Nannocystis pusilla]|uniref:AraC family transcriptional regulator ligand-binding domain-containing protein n=1 Tax=Nannocystis pusilla TaxID=889268 RepID=A0ABS7TXM2_9BACT|nr:AraC family transcriptional regulator ligand-binding domain-containing protein [Nannocystis pusilla]MBZ5712901.1 AraC family transcriptional regulator ligand-binding domain-containing protein [Nannocystis pusilla]
MAEGGGDAELLLLRPGRPRRVRPEPRFRAIDLAVQICVKPGPIPCAVRDAVLRRLRADGSESFSPPLFAALCSPNLLCAARRVAQYKRLIGPMRIDVTEERDVVSFELTWLDAPLTPPPTPPPSLVVTELLFSVVIARMATREPVRPIEVTTTVLPTPIGAYEQFLGVRMRRGIKHRVSFSPSCSASRSRTRFTAPSGHGLERLQSRPGALFDRRGW